MTKSQIEVITSVERRRRWTAAEKERLVAASLEPGAVVSALAREFIRANCMRGGVIYAGRALAVRRRILRQYGSPLTRWRRACQCLLA